MNFLAINLAICIVFLTGNYQCASLNKNQWEQFKLDFGKEYASAEEELIREKIFNENFKIIQQNFGLAVNQFTDLTNDEFRQMYTNTIYDKGDYYADTAVHCSHYALRDSTFALHLNYSAYLPPIGDQGLTCQSCYAFSAIGIIEAAFAIRHEVLVHLSKQELLDCTYYLNSTLLVKKHYENRGCQGGNVGESLEYIKNHGIHDELSYPYRSFNKAYIGKCQTEQIHTNKYHITGYSCLPASGVTDSEIMTLIKRAGPVSAGIVTDFQIGGDVIYFKHYNGHFILNHTLALGLHGVDHNIILTGWGHENGMDYWLFRNSWGHTWGDFGYGKIERGHNLLHVNDHIFYI